MIRDRVVLGIWLGLGVAWVAWNGTRTIHIGRMVLPTDQAIALAATLYLGLSLVAAWLWAALRWIARRAGYRGPEALVERRGVRRVLLVLLALAAPLYIYTRFVEPRWVTVEPVALGRALPAGQEPVRLAVIADLHIEGEREPWTSLAETVNAADPDLILFLGDTLNRQSGLPVLHRVLGEMKARHGKYAVKGNWESWYWGHLPLLQGTGFEWVDRRSVSLDIRGQRIHLVGASYRDYENGRRLETILAGLPADEWRIFAYHTPDLAEKVRSADLYLAGHTHGGQVALPLFGALVTLSEFGKRFERGAVRVGDMLVYTNPGIGVEPMVQLRFLVRPEVTLFLLGAR